MSKKTMNLSILEEDPVEIPEEIQRITAEAFQLIWKNAHTLAQQEVAKIKQHYQQREEGILHQRQEALNKVEEVNREIGATKQVIETLKRENKTLEADLNQKIGELKGVQDQVAVFQEEYGLRDQEIKHLTAEIARLQEGIETLKKRFYEVSRQAEQDRAALEAAKEEVVVNLRNRERLEKNLKATLAESEQIWKQLRTEQNRSAVAEALVQELRESLKKIEGEIKVFKAEKQELRESLDTEIRARAEVERKLVAISVRAEAQETGYKELIAKLEKELEATKNEAATIRNRMIKTEGALERERKAMERLETKLVAAGGTKLSP